MKVQWKEPDDVQRLRELERQTVEAKQRDRYRVVLIAGEGLGERPELDRQAIAAASAGRVSSSISAPTCAATTGRTGSTRRGKDLRDAAIDAWRRVCLVPELVRSVCADTALRANKI